MTFSFNVNVNVNVNLKLVEFFVGTGAFSVGFNQSPIFANDFCPNSKKIFDANHRTQLTLKNIHELSDMEIPDEIDIITAGVPCQAFSISGEKKGFEDERTQVFWKLLDIVDKKRPKCLVIENVKNLKTHDNGQSLNRIIKSLEEIGYHVVYEILNVSELTGIPQNRERIFIVAFREKKHMDMFQFPNNIEHVCVHPIVEYLESEDGIEEKYYYSRKSKIYDRLVANISKDIVTNSVYQWRRKYVRENKTGVCPTLTANMGTGGHNVPIIMRDGRIRKLTPRECFNLQGFPRDYVLPSGISDSGLYKLAGNAVNVEVVRRLATNILNTIIE